MLGEISSFFQTTAGLIFALVLLFIGGFIGRIGEFCAEMLQNRRYEKKRNLVNIKSVVIPENSSFEKYLDYAFENRKSTSGNLSIDDTKKVHDFLTKKCQRINTKQHTKQRKNRTHK